MHKNREILPYILSADEALQKQTWVISKVEEFNKMRADFLQKPIEPAQIAKDVDLKVCETNILVNVYQIIYQGRQPESLAKIIAYNARRVELIKQEELARKQKE